MSRCSGIEKVYSPFLRYRRITSYNVCYTKLLRHELVEGPVAVAGDGGTDVLGHVKGGAVLAEEHLFVEVDGGEVDPSYNFV